MLLGIPIFSHMVGLRQCCEHCQCTDHVGSAPEVRRFHLGVSLFGSRAFHLYIVIQGRGIGLAVLGSFPIGMQVRYVVVGHSDGVGMGGRRTSAKHSLGYGGVALS